MLKAGKDLLIILSPFQSVLGDIYKVQHLSHSKMIQDKGHIYHLEIKITLIKDLYKEKGS